jgi:hypothetical protein
LYWPRLPAACILTLTTSVGWAAKMARVPVVTPEKFSLSHKLMINKSELL